MNLKIKLVAYNIELYYSWKECFKKIDSVSVFDGDILEYKADAIVSPANSFGYMDGGLDLKYSQYFGWDLEKRLRKEIENNYYGEIPVGNALIIETKRMDIPYLISAPTMRVPMNIEKTINAYLAFKGLLQAVISFNNQKEKQIKSILCPGLGTGEGRLPYQLCALQMYEAYKVCILNGMETKGGLVGASNSHMRLLGLSK